MSDFYNFTGFSPDTPTEEFDRIAVERAGILGGTGYGFACPQATSQIPQAPEWGTQVINRQGMGNHGVIVLVGLTPRTKMLVREGKIRRLTTELGVPPRIAEVAVSMRYGMEISVAMLAAEAVEAIKVRGPFRGQSHKEFNEWLGRPSEHTASLSFPRKIAAAAIAEELIWK